MKIKESTVQELIRGFHTKYPDRNAILSAGINHVQNEYRDIKKTVDQYEGENKAEFSQQVHGISNLINAAAERLKIVIQTRVQSSEIYEALDDIIGQLNIETSIGPDIIQRISSLKNKFAALKNNGDFNSLPMEERENQETIIRGNFQIVESILLLHDVDVEKEVRELEDQSTSELIDIIDEPAPVVEPDHNATRQLYTKGSKIEQDLVDRIKGIDESTGIDKKKFRAKIEDGYSDYRTTKSIPESIDSEMEWSGLKDILSTISTKNNTAIRSKNSNKVEAQLSEVIKFKGELKSALTALPRKMSDAQSAYYYVIKVAISELNKMESALYKELKPLQAIEYKEARDAIREMLEKGHNLDPLISRRDPNSPHKKFMEEFNSIEAKINAGNNPGQFLDRLHEMKAQLEEAKPKVIMGSRRSAAEPAASVSAKAPPIPPRPGNRASTSEINITVNVDNISMSIDKLVNSPGPSSISVQPLKAVSDYNRLRTEIASSNTTNPEKLKGLEENRRILTQAMGFGEQIERLEKLANDSKVLSSPDNLQKMLAAVTKLSKKLNEEVVKLEKDQKINPRANAAADVIDVALIKLDQFKAKVVQSMPSQQRAKEETRHFKQ